MHYDLYASLGIPPAAPTQGIRAHLLQRLEEKNLTNLGGEEEVRAALSVLGDPQKRQLYDSMLNDPNSPTITVDAIRQLRELRIDHNGEEAPSFSQETNSSGQKFIAEPSAVSVKKRSRKSWAPIFGAGVVGVLVGITSFWGVGAVASSNGDSAVRQGAIDKVNEFLEISDHPAARQWVKENSNPQKSERILEKLDYKTAGIYQNFTQYFGMTTTEATDAIIMTSILHEYAGAYEPNEVQELMDDDVWPLDLMYSDEDFEYVLVPLKQNWEIGGGFQIVLIKSGNSWELDSFESINF